MTENQTRNSDSHGWVHVFAEGVRYRVIADCEIHLWRVYHFRIGEILTFCRDYYSPYDGLSIFLLRTTSGEERHWILHDSEPIEKWRQCFERLDDPAA